MTDSGFTMPAAAYPTTVATDYNLPIQINNTNFTLATSILSTDLTIVVLEDISEIPSQGIVTINNERIRYSSVNFLTKTITILSTADRGFDGSTPASHTAGAAIRFHVVAYHHNALVKEVEALQTRVGSAASIIQTSGDYSMGVNDISVYVSATGGNRTVTLQSPSGIVGKRIVIAKVDSTSNSVTISGSVNSGTNYVLNIQNEEVELESIGTTWQVI